jgi:hypothetical protein
MYCLEFEVMERLFTAICVPNHLSAIFGVLQVSIWQRKKKTAKRHGRLAVFLLFIGR